MRRIAVIGSGVAGLAAAWRLSASNAAYRVSLFEAGQHFGGHAHTVDLTLDGVTHGVDTGFLVFNQRTYPLLTALFQELAVPTAPSDMTFSVQAPDADGASGLEWSGSSLNTVFAQRSNLLKPSFWHLLKEILRFNRLTSRLAANGQDATLDGSIADFLQTHGFGQAFQANYLLPMIGCIWSSPTQQMLRFPVRTLIRFCHNHGLLQISNRPQWYTVRGGSRNYVRQMLGRLGEARLNTPVLAVQRKEHGVMVLTAQGAQLFDAVVMACHSDQAMLLLGDDATPQETTVLGAIRYQHNEAVLHTDTSVLPRRKLAWAAWNYERSADVAQEGARVCLHYLINHLQPLPWSQPVIVSLNPIRPIDAAQVHRRIDYSHPVFDLPALQAQAQVPQLQGQRNTWFCGAWCGYGFHEDGLRSGLEAADALMAALQARDAQPLEHAP